MFNKLKNKIADRVVSRLKNEDSKMKAEMDYNYIDYDKEISDKMKEMLKNILKYSHNVNISIVDEQININCSDIEDIKKPKNYNSHNLLNSKLVNEDNNMSIRIIKDRGFVIILGYEYDTREFFMDTEIYSYFLPIMKKEKIKLAKQKFNYKYNEIMKKSKLIRDHNLNSILDLDI